MKKLLALLAALMICGSSFALAEDGAQAVADDEPVLSFDIQVNKVPEGYTYTTAEVGEDKIAVFTPADETAAIIYVEVSHSADFEDYTFDQDLTGEENAQMIAALTEDYSDPTVQVMTTASGEKYVVVQENNTETDVADIVTVWNGYLIWIGLQKDTEITQADMDLAGTVLQDIVVVSNP